MTSPPPTRSFGQPLSHQLGIWLSLLPYLAALMLPVDRTDSDFRGWHCLVFGPLFGAFAPIIWVMWLANPAFFRGLYCLGCGCGRAAAVWGAAAVGLGCISFLHLSLSPGCLAWILAMCVLVVSGLSGGTVLWREATRPDDWHDEAGADRL